MKKSYQKAQKPRDGVRSYKHDLGQHFLYDEMLLRHLVASTGVDDQDDVLEIGAGSGMLTSCLCQTVHQVITVEVDQQVLPFLRLKTEGYDNLTIVEGDIRKQDLQTLCAPLKEGFSVIANIPYNITTSIFEMLFASRLPMKQIAVMIQKEVADKVLAKPSTSSYGLLSVLCQYHSEPILIADVPAEAFTPPPKVDSAFISLRMRETPRLNPSQEALFMRMVKAGFQLRRKTLPNALGGVVEPAKLKLAMEAISLPSNIRGEALDVDTWVALTHAYESASV